MVKTGLMVFMALILMSSISLAYIDAAGGGLIFQLVYILFGSLLVFLAMPFKKIKEFFRNKFSKRGNKN